jgi:RNA polymerase sigma-70 factor, ECF subfamily
MEVQCENELIARVQAGHASDFEHLVRCYQQSLFRIVANLVDNAIVEDLVQDIFLVAYEKIQCFDPRRGTFRAWIYRIARNHALNARKKKRERLMDEMPDIADERSSPWQELLAKEVFTCMDQALSELKFQDRVIFVLAELEGLSYAEIAQVENLALGTVKSRLARIKIKLRGALAAYVN